MNREDLIRLLEKEGIPSSWYSLYGELLPGRTVLYENYDKWEVFSFSERGSREMLRICRSEASACDFIHEEMVRSMLVNKGVLFSQPPVLLPQTVEVVKDVGIMEVVIHVWLDSMIGQEGTLPEDINGFIFELEKLDHERYNIRFWGSKEVCILDGVARFSVDYIPFHDWIQICSEKEETDLEEEISDIICRCNSDEGNVLYRKLFERKKLYVGFQGRIHFVQNT